MKLRKGIQDISEIRVRRRRGKMLFTATIGLLAVATILVALLLLVLRTPIFRVKQVEVRGFSRVAEADVRSFLSARVPHGWLGHLLGSRTILTWPDGFQKEELALLPEVDRIDISKNYFRRKVTVTVTEAERKGVWCFDAATPPKCYWFDGEGRMLRRVSAMYGNLILVVHDTDRTEIPKGEPVLPARLIPNLISIIDELRETDLGIKDVLLEDLGREELRVKTAAGPDLLFSLRFRAPDLAVALRAIRSEMSFADLQYVDLRVERRAYYR